MKAQEQFSWIFIVIAGAVILSFFATFAFKYQSLQEEKLAIELLINLDNAFFNLQSSPFNTFDIIEIPKNVQITCNSLKIGNRNYSSTNLIFSPKELNDKIYIWYKPFNFPFKADNFYYITSSKNKFYLIANDEKTREFAKSLVENLPDKIKQNFYIENIKQPNGKNIFLYNSQTNDVKIINQDNKFTVFYNDKIYEDASQELIYGAIFSDDFECLYNKLRLNLEDIIKTYGKKSLILQNSKCNYANFNLKELKELRYQNAERIEKLNENLASLSCPPLY